MKQNTRFSTHVFNLRLFWEGLKRLRVIGITSAILALTVSALIPSVAWLEWLGTQHTTAIFANTASIPTALMVLVAPFFFLVLFSFLWKRRDSDFFHAIPYTRTCVYISFTLAALVFIMVIQFACSLVSGALWTLCPYTTIDLGTLVGYTLVCVEAAVMLSAFMVIAMTVSGSGWCILLFCLFASFTRIVAAVFLGMVETVPFIPTADLWENSIASPLWFAPLSVLYYLLEDSAAEVFFGMGNILYSVVVTAGLYAFGGFLYGRRRSEMAGNPAPGVRSQTLFRVMFALIPALLMSMFFVTEGGVDISWTLILLVGTLLVYFLYELITTRRARNMVKALPGLGFVAAGCAVFLISFFGWRAFVLNERVEADDIRTVSIENNGFAYLSYPQLVGEDVLLDDPIVRSVVADAYAASQNNDMIGSRAVVTMKLKGGRTIHRKLYLTEDQKATLSAHCQTLPAYRDLFMALPAADQVERVYMDFGLNKNADNSIWLNDKDAKLKATMDQLISVFHSEYATLDEAARVRVTADMLAFGTQDPVNDVPYLELTGVLMQNGYERYFMARYRLTDDLPKTRDACLAVWSQNTSHTMNGNYYEGGQTAIPTVLQHFREQNAEGLFAQDTVSAILCFRTIADGKSLSSPVTVPTTMKPEEVEAVLALLSHNRSLSDVEDITTYRTSSDTCLVDFQAEDTTNSDTLVRITGLFELDLATLSELKTLLHIAEK